MESLKNLLLLTNVESLSNLSPNLAYKIADQAKSLGYRMSLCLISSCKFEMNQQLVVVFASFIDAGNLHGIETVIHLEEDAENVLNSALLKMEMQEKNRASMMKDFPEYSDCPFFYCIHKERYVDVAEIEVDGQGKISMRVDCVHEKFTLGNVADKSLREILELRNGLQEELFGKILSGNSEGKFSCRNCPRVEKMN